MKRVGNGMRRVLIVEDYEDVRRMLKILLESEHFRVLEAGSGAEALKLISSGRPDPDVILMDLALPGFDGFETIRRIRQIDGFRNTPIIVITAYTGQSIYETAFHAGTTYFMTKPVDFDELAELLERILGDGNGGIPKYSRPPAQRAVIRNGVQVSRLRPEVRPPI
jgi:CheY-like chemotaxis protein